MWAYGPIPSFGKSLAICPGPHPIQITTSKTTPLLRIGLPVFTIRNSTTLNLLANQWKKQQLAQQYKQHQVPDRPSFLESSILAAPSLTLITKTQSTSATSTSNNNNSILPSSAGTLNTQPPVLWDSSIHRKLQIHSPEDSTTSKVAHLRHLPDLTSRTFGISSFLCSNNFFFLLLSWLTLPFICLRFLKAILPKHQCLTSQTKSFYSWTNWHASGHLCGIVVVNQIPKSFHKLTQQCRELTTTSRMSSLTLNNNTQCIPLPTLGITLKSYWFSLVFSIPLRRGAKMF